MGHTTGYRGKGGDLKASSWPCFVGGETMGFVDAYVGSPRCHTCIPQNKSIRVGTVAVCALERKKMRGSWKPPTAHGPKISIKAPLLPRLCRLDWSSSASVLRFQVRRCNRNRCFGGGTRIPLDRAQVLSLTIGFEVFLSFLLRSLRLSSIQQFDGRL